MVVGVLGKTAANLVNRVQDRVSKYCKCHTVGYFQDDLWRIPSNVCSDRKMNIFHGKQGYLNQKIKIKKKNEKLQQKEK